MKEASLIKDAVTNIQIANQHIDELNEDLANKSEICLRQQEDLTGLLSKNISHEGKIKKLTIELTELQAHLAAAQESQRALTTEVYHMLA